MIRQLYKDVAAIPTGYFEAKPQRAVGFDEVKAAVLPDNASETLVNSLKEQGVPVYQYKAGDDAKRTEILNKLPNVRFQKAEQADRDAKQNQQPRHPVDQDQRQPGRPDEAGKRDAGAGGVSALGGRGHGQGAGTGRDAGRRGAG